MHIADTTSEDVAKIVKVMRDLKPGNILTYKSASRVLGMDADGKGRGRIYKAMKLASEEFGAAFALEYKVGYRRLQPKEVGAQHAATAISSIRRKAKRAGKVIGNNLRHSGHLMTAAEKRADYARVAHLGLFEAMSSQKTVKKMPEIFDKRPSHDEINRAWLMTMQGLAEEKASGRGIPPHQGDDAGVGATA